MVISCPWLKCQPQIHKTPYISQIKELKYKVRNSGETYSSFVNVHIESISEISQRLIKESALPIAKYLPQKSNGFIWNIYPLLEKKNLIEHKYLIVKNKNMALHV